jgi:hypothetical protein
MVKEKESNVNLKKNQKKNQRKKSTNQFHKEKKPTMDETRPKTMFGRLSSTFWTLSSYLFTMTGLITSYIALSAIVRHFGIPWYFFWVLAVILFLVYQSVHIFHLEEDQLCVFTRLGREKETIFGTSNVGWNFRLGFFLTRQTLKSDVRILVSNIEAMTNNFIGITLNLVLELTRTKGIPRTLNKITPFVDSQVRIALLSYVQSLTWNNRTGFAFKANAIVPRLVGPLATYNLAIKSLNQSNIQIYTTNVFPDHNNNNGNISSGARQRPSSVDPNINDQ